MATLEQTPRVEDLDPFLAWLPDEFKMRVAVKRENDQWFALYPDFDITGAGDTIADAVTQGMELVALYLNAYFEEGEPFQAAKRPIPLRLRARIALESGVASLLRHTALRLPLADERTYSLPPSLLPRLAS